MFNKDPKSLLALLLFSIICLSSKGYSKELYPSTKCFSRKPRRAPYSLLVILTYKKYAYFKKESQEEILSDYLNSFANNKKNSGDYVFCLVSESIKKEKLRELIQSYRDETSYLIFLGGSHPVGMQGAKIELFKEHSQVPESLLYYTMGDQVQYHDDPKEKLVRIHNLNDKDLIHSTPIVTSWIDGSDKSILNYLKKVIEFKRQNESSYLKKMNVLRYTDYNNAFSRYNEKSPLYSWIPGQGNPLEDLARTLSLQYDRNIAFTSREVKFTPEQEDKISHMFHEKNQLTFILMHGAPYRSGPLTIDKTFRNGPYLTIAKSCSTGSGFIPKLLGSENSTALLAWAPLSTAYTFSLSRFDKTLPSGLSSSLAFEFSNNNVTMTHFGDPTLPANLSDYYSPTVSWGEAIDNLDGELENSIKFEKFQRSVLSGYYYFSPPTDGEIEEWLESPNPSKQAMARYFREGFISREGHDLTRKIHLDVDRWIESLEKESDNIFLKMLGLYLTPTDDSTSRFHTEIMPYLEFPLDPSVKWMVSHFFDKRQDLAYAYIERVIDEKKSLSEFFEMMGLAYYSVLPKEATAYLVEKLIEEKNLPNQIVVHALKEIFNGTINGEMTSDLKGKMPDLIEAYKERDKKIILLVVEILKRGYHVDTFDFLYELMGKKISIENEPIDRQVIETFLFNLENLKEKQKQMVVKKFKKVLKTIRGHDEFTIYLTIADMFKIYAQVETDEDIKMRFILEACYEHCKNQFDDNVSKEHLYWMKKFSREKILSMLINDYEKFYDIRNREHLIVALLIGFSCTTNDCKRIFRHYTRRKHALVVMNLKLLIEVYDDLEMLILVGEKFLSWNLETSIQLNYLRKMKNKDLRKTQSRAYLRQETIKIFKKYLKSNHEGIQVLAAQNLITFGPWGAFHLKKMLKDYPSIFSSKVLREIDQAM